MQTDYDNNLQTYFTDMEYLRGMFTDFVSAQKMSKRLIIFHGVGGVGKSSLLRMFRLHCKSEKIPVALVSADDAKSVFDIIMRWTEDLKEDGVKFSSLSKTLETYRAIQAKVDDQAKKSQTAGSRIADMAGKAASKTAETAGGALLGAVIGSFVPGVGAAIGGTLGSVVSGMGAEALTDWLRGFLTKPDIDLLLDPAKRLRVDFFEDIAKTAEKKRIVLLLDTFEQMSALEDWIGEVAQKIHPNVLVVIAGRKLPDWNRVWSGWMMNAQVEELKPMTEDIMRQLIHRYYSTMCGGEPDPAQVDAIIKFARGLPMVVTSAVQLWVKYDVEDFQSVKVEIVANLVDSLMEGVPSELIPALEAAAVVRWFDQPILRAVIKQEDVRDVYNELRRFPFVRTRAEGLALHDSVREMMDENLRTQDSERHSNLHERAAMYFEKRLEKATDEEAERLGLERLYHRVRADEKAGIKLFQEVAEEITRYRFGNRLLALINDINTYPLELENSQLWRKYYFARLKYLESNIEEAKKEYEIVGENKHAEPKLRAYAMCDLGYILRRREFLRLENGKEKAIKVLESCLSQEIKIDRKIAISWAALADVYIAFLEWEKALLYIGKAKDFFTSIGDTVGMIETLRHEIGVYARQGDFQKVLVIWKYIDEIIDREEKLNHTKVHFKKMPDWCWMGRYYEWEISISPVLENARLMNDAEDLDGHIRDLGLALAMQDKCSDAVVHLEEGVNLSRQLGKAYNLGLFISLSFSGIGLLRCGRFDNAENRLVEAIKHGENINAHLDFAPLYLAILYETVQKIEKAEGYYCLTQSISKSNARHYFESSALAGLIRVKHTQGDIAAIPSLLEEAEQLAQQYEYNDHLASLRLTQGHLALENGNQDNAFFLYQKAMIYALRYNRFLLDELISGRSHGTPLRPIIPYFLERGEEGKKILLALRDWWRIGVNDIGAPRPDTISPIPEGISLLEAEKIAREREPGDGSVQKSVIEQIETVL
jgi:tetratricopeptide (TPR) repeat protein